MRCSFRDDSTQRAPRDDADDRGYEDLHEHLHRYGVRDEKRGCENERDDQPLAVERRGGAEGEEKEVARADEAQDELYARHTLRERVDDDDRREEQQSVEGRPHEQHVSPS